MENQMANQMAIRWQHQMAISHLEEGDGGLWQSYGNQMAISVQSPTLKKAMAPSGGGSEASSGMAEEDEPVRPSLTSEGRSGGGLKLAALPLPLPNESDATATCNRATGVISRGRSPVQGHDDGPSGVPVACS